ncbi:Uncharacterised protein [Vibrio cholerae]|nr:Uncharacterised protein [Vibrio cholerae]
MMSNRNVVRIKQIDAPTLRQKFVLLILMIACDQCLMEH